MTARDDLRSMMEASAAPALAALWRVFSDQTPAATLPERDSGS